MVVELTISLRDEEKRSLSRKYLVYETVTMDTHDPIIDSHLTELIKEFNGEVSDVKIRALMVVS